MKGGKVQMNTQTKSKGFTIIEVVLVLAIAGLIFLMVFIALPALQRNQKDSDRKAQVGKVVAAIVSWQSNNSTAIPSVSDGKFEKYLDSKYVTGAGVTTGIPLGATTLTAINSVTAAGTTAVTTDEVIIYMGAKCGVNNAFDKGSSKRQAAVFTKLENGESFYCQST